MTEEKIARINALARKSKTAQGLSAEEKDEQARLRREYVQAVVGSMESQLDNTYVLNDRGERTKLKKKEEKS